MKTVKITIVMKVTDEHYEFEMKEVKKEILSGKFQREMIQDSKGKALDIKATFEELK